MPGPSRNALFLLGALLVAGALLAPFSTARASQWYNTAWLHRKLLTVNYSQVSSSTTSTISNFPVLVGIASDTNLAAETVASGSDILFTNSDGVSLLNFEIEHYVSSTGELEAWVKLPTVSTSTNTLFYMYYNNPSSTTSLQTPTNTWDSNYSGVWHLPTTGTSTLSAKDSTANANNGTIVGSATSTAGKIDGAVNLNGSSQDITTPLFQSSSTAETIEAWVNVSSTVSTTSVIVQDRGSGAGHSLTLALDGNGSCGSTGCGNQFMGIPSSTGKLMFGDDSANIWIGVEASNTAINNGQWHYVVGTWAAASGTSVTSTQFSVYVDGSATTTGKGGTGSDTSPLTGLASTTIGYHQAWTSYFKGKIDEVRISKIIRPLNWIQTEYNDENSPGTFITEGSEESPPSFTLADYRWFANIASTSVGLPLAAQNATATAQLVTSSTFRLRILIRVAGSQVDSNTQSFNLQYVEAGTGNCAAPSGGNPASYTNVATSSGLVQYYANAGVTDGSPLTPTTTDPVDGSSTIVIQTYDASNPFTNSQGPIPAAADGKWDLSLADNGAKVGADYCFRAVTASGTVFASYAVYPQIVIGEVAPSASNVTLIGNSGSNISLVAGTTTLIQATATVSDANGYTDLSTTTATFYRTSLGPSCTADNNDCYRNVSCALSLCYATACTATCGANLWYFAQPTDSGTPWAGDSWSAAVQATDAEGATSSVATSTGIPLLSLVGLQMTSSISYGSLAPGSGTPSLAIPTVIMSLGNVSLNVTLYGTNMTSGSSSLGVGAQDYATSMVAYASGNSLLPSPGTTTLLAIPKTTSSANPASAALYWGVSLPVPQSSGDYTGVNTFIGVRNSLPWP
ncbi:MAG: DUF2341 domain-containing protein [Minisyncoccia bacterium]|jgi:hypothetical protein